ncbi:amino acid adenylation domain-containing protein [Kineothrix alysoides]|uniref:Amino acid adenylation domain-containing protein n=1 Tax=Kineothrix alysoides TaxID=1469948 RepID=A0A4R1QW59_9FIRM|nr:non-ribosomal peptide synthetase [Kineothrix alysoides]TCL57593.1 amino acid adenylation domain-containing protein [Kineothrix alysoides]
MSEKLIFQQIMYEKLQEYSSRQAYVCGDEKMSYEEVNNHSDMILEQLHKKGLKKSDQIILFMEKRTDLLLSIIACLKGAFIFVPFDTDIPDNRLKNMYEEIDGRLIITDRTNYDRVAGIIGKNAEENQILIIDEMDRNDRKVIKSEYNEALYTPDDPIYIFYTSGSTGKPKAIIGCNKSLRHFIEWETETFSGWENAVVSQLTTPGHDPILRDIFAALLTGGTVAIPENKEGVLNINKLVSWINSMKVTHIHCTPGIFHAMVENKPSKDDFKELKYVLMAGEKLNIKALKEWYGIFGERITLVNMYGATETTMIKMYHVISSRDIERGSVPIGVPMKGAAVIILDEHQKVRPKGTIGEIYIRTPYRSLGYYNKDLNAGCFITNPYSNGDSDILYKTGDLGKVLNDGNIEFHGRIDRQVKIRGIRVELSEIEKHMTEFNGIRNAAVVMKQKDNADKIMAAFYTADEAIDQEELKNFLNARMNDNIIPVLYIGLQEMPLLSNGKMDYQALENYKAELKNDLKKPSNDIEAKMADIWKDILEINEVGVDQNFLHIGGHSLNIMTMITRINREFDVELSLSEIFSNATIENLAAIIEKREKGAEEEKIRHINRGNVFPLSDTQKRMYALWRSDMESTVYNMPAAYWVTGKIDKEKLENAIKKVISNNVTLRVKFVQNNNEIQQEIVEDIDFSLISGNMEEKDAGQYVESFIRPFDLENAPLIRGALMRAGDRHLFAVDIHHIIGDAISMEIMIKQITDAYAGTETEKAEIQYDDYCDWSIRYRKRESYLKQEKYWLDAFKEIPPLLNFKTDYERRKSNSNKGRLIYFDMASELSEMAYDFAAKNCITPNLLFLAIYVLLLYRYTGQNDITVGTVAAGRMRPEENNIIGPFINTLALHNTFKRKISFSDFLDVIKNTAVEAYENQEYAFNLLVEQLNIQYEAGRNPLFDFVFDFQNESRQQIKLENLEFTPIKLKIENARFDFCLHVTEADHAFSFGIEYKTGLFKEKTICRFAQRFRTLLINCLTCPEAGIEDMEMLDEGEKKSIFEFMGNIDQNSGFGTVDAMFDRCSRENADITAIEYYDEENVKQIMTYGELYTKAEDLAEYLSTKGIRRGDIVGIYMNKIHNAIIAMLGILKAGAVYLPVGVGYYPPKLIESMVNDSRMKILISEESKDNNINDVLEQIRDRQKGGTEIVKYDAVLQEKAEGTKKACTDGCHNEEDLAYIIYTSGTTGVPKGVMLKHKGLVNVAQSMGSVMRIKSKARVLQFSSLSFDMSVWEIFTTLLNGGTLCILDRNGKQRDEIDLFLRDENINIATLTPSLLRIIDPEKLSELRVVVSAGENCSEELLEKWNKDRIFINAYGPTETTICATLNIVNDKNASNIGKPIKNTLCTILNENRDICPIGIPGELYVGGVGVGAGYLNNEELSGEKFVAVSGQRMYRTGDQVLWNEEGNIEILGRCDEQVKIRGFRIEIGQVEARIRMYQGITDSVVAKSDTDELYAFYAGNEKVKKGDLLNYLKQELPSYMIPSYVMRVEHIPVTAGGKIDKRKLLDSYIEDELEITDKASPRNSNEMHLLQIWKEVLKREDIGIDDNFFEIGGHSLNVIQIISKSKEAGFDIKVSDIYSRQTIKSISDLNLI